MIDKKELLEIIDTLHFVREQKKLNVKDDILFQEDCAYHRGQIINENRKVNPYANIVKPIAKEISQNQSVKSETATTGDTSRDSKDKEVNKSPSPTIKLITESQIAYIQQLADETNTKVNLNNKLTSKEASAMIKELNNKKFKK